MDQLSNVAMFALAFLGYKVAILLKDILAALYARFLRPSVNLQKYGKWAVVTGATDGIGKGYATELARKGMSVVLISRTQSKLDDTKEEITAKYPSVEVQTIAMDCGDVSQYSKVSAALEGMDVGILVNNVGISYAHPEFYLDLPAERLEQLVNLNIHAMNHMIRIVMPGMVERKRGAVVNISSASGSFPCSLLSVYSSTKAYMDNMSICLDDEYGRKGIFVQSLMPLYVASKLSKMRASFFTATPTQYARSAVATLGHDKRTFGYIPHKIQMWVLATLPWPLVRKTLWGMHMSVRARALKKAAAAKQN